VSLYFCAVSVVFGVWPGWCLIVFLTGGTKFTLLQNVRTCCVPPPQPHIQWVSGLKQPGHSAEVKEWKYTTLTCLHAMHRDNFTFSFITRVLESYIVYCFKEKMNWVCFSHQVPRCGSLWEWSSIDRAYTRSPLLSC